MIVPCNRIVRRGSGSGIVSVIGGEGILYVKRVLICAGTTRWVAGTWMSVIADKDHTSSAQ